MDLILDTNTLNPGQRLFLEDQSWACLMAGGYGTGKTTILAIKMLQLIAANPGIPGLLIAPTWRTMWSTTYRSLMSLLRRSVPREHLPALVDKHGECYLDFGGGSHLFLRSAKNIDGFEGIDVGYLGGDEARLWSRTSKDVAFGRVRVRCPRSQRALVSTPSMGWLDEEFNQERANRTLVRAPTYENLHNLQDDYIDNLKLSYSPRLQKAYIEGYFVVLEGAVYEQFDCGSSSPWIVDYNYKPHIDHETQLWVDPGFRRSSWGLVRPYGPRKNLQWVMFKEFQLDNKSTLDSVEFINNWCQVSGVRIDRVWTDPASDAKDEATGYSVIRALKNLNFRSSNRRSICHITGFHRSISTSVDRVRVLLGDPDHEQPQRLLFSRGLYNEGRNSSRSVMKSLASYSYPECKDGRPIQDIPLKDGIYDHACDMVRYGGTGMFLTTPELRKHDRSIGQGARGYVIK